MVTSHKSSFAIIRIERIHIGVCWWCVMLVKALTYAVCVRRPRCKQRSFSGRAFWVASNMTNGHRDGCLLGSLLSAREKCFCSDNCPNHPKSIPSHPSILSSLEVKNFRSDIIEQALQRPNSLHKRLWSLRSHWLSPMNYGTWVFVIESLKGWNWICTTRLSSSLLHRHTNCFRAFIYYCK